MVNFESVKTKVRTTDLNTIITLMHFFWNPWNVFIICQIDFIVYFIQQFALVPDHQVQGLNVQKLTDAKNVLEVILSNCDNAKLLQDLKSDFKRIDWNKYQSKATTETQKQHLDYLTDPIF